MTEDVWVILAFLLEGLGLVVVGVWSVGKIVATTESLRVSIVALERTIEKLDVRVTALDRRTVVLGERTAGLEWARDQAHAREQERARASVGPSKDGP